MRSQEEKSVTPEQLWRPGVTEVVLIKLQTGQKSKAQQGPCSSLSVCYQAVNLFLSSFLYGRSLLLILIRLKERSKGSRSASL